MASKGIHIMRLEKAKRFIADIIEPRKKASALSIIYNVLMSIVVIVSCVFVFIDIFTASEGNQQKRFPSPV